MKRKGEFIAHVDNKEFPLPYYFDKAKSEVLIPSQTLELILTRLTGEVDQVVQFFQNMEQRISLISIWEPSNSPVYETITYSSRDGDLIIKGSKT